MRSRHYECLFDPRHPFTGCYHFGAATSRETLHLNTLRVCRKVYHEANTILWSTNIFSFFNAKSLEHFLRARRPHQVPLLRRLRLQMDWIWEKQRWDSVDSNLIRSLTGLRSMRLQIKHSMKARRYGELSARGNQPGTFQSDFPGFMHRLATLPLREVEVAVSDYSLKITDLWTPENRKEYAQGIREMLLNPKEAETQTFSLSRSLRLAFMYMAPELTRYIYNPKR